MQLTIGKKLGLGFGFVLLIFAISGLVTITQIRNIHKNLDEIIQVEEPTSAAAYEMEINLIGTGFGLLGYLEDRDPKHLERIKGDVDDFRKYQKKYSELAETEKGKELGVELNNEYDKFKILADKIIGLEDEQDTKIVTLYKNHEEMDNLLDEKIQISIKPGEPQAYKKMQAAMEMEINVNGIAKGLGEFLRVNQAKYEQRVLKDESDFRQFLKVYESLGITPEEKQWALEMRRLFEESVELSKEIIQLDKEIGTGRDEFIKIRRDMDVLMDDEIQVLTDQDLKTSEEDAKRSINTANILVLALLLGGIIIGSIAAIVITRGITNPLRLVVSRVDEIAGAAGDLTTKVPEASRDEIGDLAKTFNKMLAGLKAIVIRILSTAGSVSASSQQLSSAAQQSNASVQQISSTIQQLARGSQTQAQRVAETANVMEQLNTSISQSAQSAQQAASASAQASQSAQKGAETIKETVSTMDKIFDSTNNASEVVKKLGERSEQMNRIVEVMTNVADQTNLLALNASIEAARAGEAGRGFAVVAEEVGKLAENSAKSASEIGELIKETSKDTDEAVKSMENTFSLVSQGKEVVTKTSNAIEEIQQASENVSSMLQQISAASQQMSSGAKQVVKSVDEVASITEEASASTQQAGASSQQMVATMQEMASSAQSLAQMGIELNNVVGEFKTGEEERRAMPEFRAPRSRPALPSVAERLVKARMKMEEIRRPELSGIEEEPGQEEPEKKNKQET